MGFIFAAKMIRWTLEIVGDDLALLLMAKEVERIDGVGAMVVAFWLFSGF